MTTTERPSRYMSHRSWERMLDGSSCALEENSQNRWACDSFQVICTLWASLHPRHSDSTQLSLCCWGHAGRLRGGLSLSREGCVRSHSPLTPQLEGTVAGLFFFPPSKEICVYREVERVTNGIHISCEAQAVVCWSQLVIVQWYHVASLKLAMVEYHTLEIGRLYSSGLFIYLLT